MLGAKQGLGSRAAIPALPLGNFTVLGTSLNVSVPWRSHARNERNSD